MTDRPDTNLTTTEALPTGLPKSLITLTDSLVFSAAPSGNVANRNNAGNNFTMLQLCAQAISGSKKVCGAPAAAATASAAR